MPETKQSVSVGRNYLCVKRVTKVKDVEGKNTGKSKKSRTRQREVKEVVQFGDKTDGRGKHHKYSITSKQTSPNVRNVF